MIIQKPLVLPLPLTGRGVFRAVGACGKGSGFGRVLCGVDRMAGHMCGAGGLAGGAARCACSWRLSCAGGSMSGHCGIAGCTHFDLAARPDAYGFDRFPGPVVLRVPLFETMEYMLGAVSSPECQGLSVESAQ